MAAAHPKWTSYAGHKDLTDVTVNPDAAATATPRQGGFVIRNRINASNVAGASRDMWTIDDATLSDDVGIPAIMMQVPERTFVHDLTAFAIKSADVPVYTVVGAQASNVDLDSADLVLANMMFGARNNKKPTSHASYAAATHLVDIIVVNGEGHMQSGNLAGAVFGFWESTGLASSSSGSWALTDAFQKIDASLGNPTEPMNTAKRIMVCKEGVAASAISSASSLTLNMPGHYFPYGGEVTMLLGPYNTKLSSEAADSTGWYSGTTAATFRWGGVMEIQGRCSYVPE